MAGLTGVELQIAQGEPNLRDWDTVRKYKKEADRWGIQIPSLAGVWDRGVSILTSPSAGLNLVDSIRAAELLGASVILVAFFRDNAPDMSNEASFGPVVKLLQSVAPYASDAGVTLGLENSLSPADNRKLVDLVDHRNVRIYYDLHNMAHYGHGEEAIPGIKLLGKERICQVHVKNRDMLLEDEGLVDWKSAIHAFNEIQYEGWFVFESQHPDRSHLLENTKQNIEFLQLHCRMPEA
jgi:sugar phosphate isomerase/epimerase